LVKNTNEGEGYGEELGMLFGIDHEGKLAK
jgi:hypothetical protein